MNRYRNTDTQSAKAADGDGEVSEQGSLGRVRLWGLHVLEYGIPVVLGLSMLYFVAVSLFWRPCHDSPLMLYIGFAMEELGATPYVDIFDMNPPGTMLLHQGVWKLTGSSEFAQRMVDVAVLMGISGATFAYMRRWGLGVGLMAVACFGLHGLGWGATQAFQREYLCLLPVALSLVVAFRCPRWPLVWRCFVIGLLYGLVLTVKPPMGIGYPVILGGALAMHFFQRDAAGVAELWAILRGRELWLALLATCAGFVVMPLICVVYLVNVDAWSAFRELSREYWPLYAQLRGDATVRVDALESLRFKMLIHSSVGYTFLGIAAMGLFSSVPRLTRQSRADAIEMLTIVALLLAFVVYTFTSGKFWLYHSYPAFYVYSLIAGTTMWSLGQARARPLDMSIRALAIALFALLSWKTPDQGHRITEGKPFVINRDIDRVADLLKKKLEPGDTVQPFDVTVGAVHAMLLARAKLATPYMYDFYFYHHPKKSFIKKLRKRVLAGMHREKPRFVVAAVPTRWRSTGVRTAGNFPELERLVADKYKLVWRGASLSLYERKEKAKG